MLKSHAKEPIFEGKKESFKTRKRFYIVERYSIERQRSKDKKKIGEN